MLPCLAKTKQLTRKFLNSRKRLAQAVLREILGVQVFVNLELLCFEI